MLPAREGNFLPTPSVGGGREEREWIVYVYGLLEEYLWSVVGNFKKAGYV